MPTPPRSCKSAIHAHRAAVRCFYHTGYYFPLPEGHPFPIDKYWRAEAIIRAAALPSVEFITPEAAGLDTLQLVHTSAYLDSISSGNMAHYDAVKLGVPACKGMLDRCRLEVGGTIAAAQTALKEGISANLAGGTHHAFADKGLGFCVLNDVAIAIRHLHTHFPTLKCMVVDTDAHQGNGTNGIFAGDQRVFTYSIHVAKNYPAIKTPGSIDVELPRYVSGEEYLDRLHRSLPSAIQTFLPDLIFWIGGADIHADDRFGQMKLNDLDIASRDELVLDLIQHHHIPTVLTYGGGYNLDRLRTPAIHAATVLRAAARCK